MLKTAGNAAAFGLFSATTPIEEDRGKPHRVITSDGVLQIHTGTPERPGPWAFPPGAALVEGSGRLLLTLLIHEIRVRGGAVIQADTDGVFVAATPGGDEIDVAGRS
jgi:hypothetical protein